MHVNRSLNGAALYNYLGIISSSLQQGWSEIEAPNFEVFRENATFLIFYAFSYAVERRLGL